MSPRAEAPIVIIGNGGSGSTLLDRTLNAHPDIDMKGEMNFLLADAWVAFSRADANTTLWNLGKEATLARYFDADPSLEARIKASSSQYQDLLVLLERDEVRRKIDEFSRRGAVMRRSIGDWFLLDRSRAQHWGFKEITNSGDREWSCYDHVFPEARWVHIIRHPLDRLHAAARLSGQLLSSEIIPDLLRTWLATVVMSRQRRTTGRYHEIKYEELRTTPERALSPLLDDLGVGWHDDCGLALAKQWGAVSERLPLPSEIGGWVSAVDGLECTMREAGYRLDDGMLESDMMPHLPSATEAVGEGRWKLVGPFWQENARCWEVDLSKTAIANRLVTLADDIRYWERSPLRLFEDDKPLHPAHALHYQIRRDGGGRYSHWQNRLLFSTSDNSNPNNNGRTYTFELPDLELEI
jgi:Sulfotransferase family